MPAPWRRRQQPEETELTALAESLRERIAKAAEDLSNDPEAIFNAVMAELTEEGVQRRLVGIFDELDTVSQWELIAKYYGDKKIKAALKERHERIVLEADPETYNDALIAAARRDKALAAYRIRKGTMLELYLYEPKVLLGTQSDQELIGVTPDRTFVLEALGKDAEFRVRRVLINTRFTNPTTHPVTVHGLIQVGTHFPDDHQFSYSLYHHALAHYRTKDGTIHGFEVVTGGKSVSMWVGRCKLDGKEVFFDPS